MSDKWIRSIKDNPAGKVVADPSGSRWEWDRADLDETSRQLQKLQNEELAIEQTDIVKNPRGRPQHGAAPTGDGAVAQKITHKKKTADAGGGFNPYDTSAKPPRR